MAIEIVDFPIKDCDFDSYASLPEGMYVCERPLFNWLVGGGKVENMYITCMCSYAYPNI